MLYWLLYLKLYHYFPPFRIFRYLTFRTAFSSLTALFIGLFVGPTIIKKLREFQIGQYIREEGPQGHQKKAGTPTMGGVLICISIIVPTLLWADLSNKYVILVMLSTIAFGAIGFPQCCNIKPATLLRNIRRKASRITDQPRDKRYLSAI